MRYWPLPSVTAERTFSMSTGLAASTVTPGSTAPELSFTTPVMDPWAYAAAGTITRPATTSNTRVSLLIPTPFLLARVCFRCVQLPRIRHLRAGVVKREWRRNDPAGQCDAPSPGPQPEGQRYRR